MYGFYGGYGPSGGARSSRPAKPPSGASAAPIAGAGEVGQAAQITVSGCTHTNVGPIVRGNYILSGSNHDKPAYKKEQQVSGLDVMLYYWDERDGVAFSGWWFGPKIGGDQVWAYQPTRANQTPPRSGWKVPYDGPVDNSLCLAPKGGAMSPRQDAEARSAKIAEMKRQAEEQKRKLEEARLKAEENRRKIEEANKKRIEDEKRRMEEVRKKAEEQKAVFAIRQALQKMKMANLENFDKIHEEVANVMQQELEKCGSLAVMIQAEHDKGWEQVTLRMEQLQAAKQKLQEQKKAAKEKAEAYVKELEEAVAAAEAAASVLKEAVDSLSEQMAQEKLKLDQVNDLVTSIETATREANEAYQTCTEMVRKNDAIKVADPDLKELKEQHSRLMQRMAACSMSKDTCIKSSSKSKDEALKRASAKVKFDKHMALFAKYDSNKDGLLDKKEIATLAKKEFSFVMPDTTLSSILKAFAEEGSKGVKKEKLQSVKVQIGVAREKAKDVQRRKRREQHEKQLESIKDSLRTQVQEVLERLKEAEESVQKVEEDGRPLHQKGKDMKVSEMMSFADEIDLQLKAVKDLVDEVKKDLAKVKEGAEPEVALWLSNEARPLEWRQSKLEPRLGSLSSACSRFRDTMKSKDRAELLQVEHTATAMLRYHQKSLALSSEELTSGMCDLPNAVSEASFVKFFETLEKDPSENGAADELGESELKRLFAHWDEESEGSVSKETLQCHIRKLMKVMKTAALTDSMSIKDSKSIRRLSEGEVVEALGPEHKEEDAELMRLKVKAMSDGAEGWVTISGNQGTVFLKDGGHLFKVVKETILTESFALDGQSAKEATRRLRDEPRKLKANELVQVRSWMKKEEKSGLMRMKCRAVSDGAIGWATVVGNAGTVFLEVS